MSNKVKPHRFRCVDSHHSAIRDPFSRAETVTGRVRADLPEGAMALGGAWQAPIGVTLAGPMAVGGAAGELGGGPGAGKDRASFGLGNDETEAVERPEELADRRELLNRHAAALAGADIACETLLIRGDPGRILSREATRWGADLIVMGSHGRGALYRRFIGSVSEAVLKDGRHPVLVVPCRAAPQPSAEN